MKNYICEGLHERQHDELTTQATFHFGIERFWIYPNTSKLYAPGEKLHLCAKHASEIYQMARENEKFFIINEKN